MKKTILAILASLALPLAAHAGEWTTVNTDGGLIHLTTDKVANCGQGYLAWASVTGGATTLGCWQLSPDGKYFRVLWHGRDLYTYAVNTFNFEP